jgi:hypothetical protein
MVEIVSQWVNRIGKNILKSAATTNKKQDLPHLRKETKGNRMNQHQCNMNQVLMKNMWRRRERETKRG